MSSFRANKISSTIEVLLEKGFKIQEYLPGKWKIVEKMRVIGHIDFSEKNKRLSFHSYREGEGEDVNEIIDQALSLPDKLIESKVGEDTLTLLLTYSGEVVFLVNGSSKCCFNRSPENVPKNSRILREALRLFKQLAEPGVWCKAGDKDGLKVSRQIFFKKLGFKEIQETGFFVL